jgi:YD repeat-containing protein
MSYDSNGRLATYIDSDHKYSFSYNGVANLVVTRNKLSDGAVDQIIECVLNGAGAITKAEYKSNGTIIYTYQFMYDASGNLISLKGIGGGGTYEKVFTYENGVPVSLKIYDGGTLSRTEHYIYDNSRANKSGLSCWYTWPSDILHGKPLKYYLKESKEFNANGELINHKKNSFTYDAAGYPVTEVISSLIKNTTQTFTYKF